VLSHPKHPVIGLISTLPISGGFDFNSQQTRDSWAVMDEIQQLFEVRSLDPSLKRIDDDVDVLMIVHPKDLADSALYAIDQFVLRGGKALVFVDPHAEADEPPQDPSNPTAAMLAPRSSDLPKLFDAWGVSYDHDKVVLDAGRALSVGGRRGAPVRHLAFLGLDATDFDHDDVITSGLTTVNLAFTGYLQRRTAPRRSSFRS
jgi:ABC-type uncharacterized transport system involved in gliding motility auxiliary subunit